MGLGLIRQSAMDIMDRMDDLPLSVFLIDAQIYADFAILGVQFVGAVS